MTHAEEGLLGTREASKDAYWGTHTLRVIGNYQISGRAINEAPELIRVFVQVKKACTLVNTQLKTMKPAKTEAITAVCDEIVENGRCIDQFPVDQFQGGAGTSVNTNANEVIADLALEIFGEEKGRYGIISPSDHVNRSQSTNDAYPTAFRIALWRKVNRLHKAIDEPTDSFGERGAEFRHILTMGRMQLQNVVPMSLGSEFSVSVHTLYEKGECLVNNAEPPPETNLGVTAIGTGLNTPDGHQQVVVCYLRRTTGACVVGSPNLLETTSDMGAYVSMHATTKHSAVKLSKVCNDLRLSASGPRTGLNETNLPKMAVGSSIMLAKVNPVTSEVVSQACFKVTGNDQTVTIAAEAGRFQLNVMESVIAQALIRSTNLLVNACDTLRERYIIGIIANVEICRGYVENSTGIVTYFNDIIDHHLGDVVGKCVAAEGRTVHEVIHDTELLLEEEVERILSPDNLANPKYTGTEEG